MPPAPILTVTLNDAKVQEAFELLGLREPPTIRLVKTRPPTRLLGGRSLVVFGEADYTKHEVRIYTAIEQYDRDRLPFVMSEMGRTLLHELRHFQQRQDWTEEAMERDHKTAYFARRSEQDAEEWANDNLANFRTIVRVSRKFPSSNMSRLSATARRASTGRVV